MELVDWGTLPLISGLSVSLPLDTGDVLVSFDTFRDPAIEGYPTSVM